MENIYFLFGSDACGIYLEEGVEVLKEMYESNDISLGLYAWNSLESNPFSLLECYSGWGDYCSISEDEYNFLNK